MGTVTVPVCRIVQERRVPVPSFSLVAQVPGSLCTRKAELWRTPPSTGGLAGWALEGFPGLETLPPSTSAPACSGLRAEATTKQAPPVPPAKEAVPKGRTCWTCNRGPARLTPGFALCLSPLPPRAAPAEPGSSRTVAGQPCPARAPRAPRRSVLDGS